MNDNPSPKKNFWTTLIPYLLILAILIASVSLFSTQSKRSDLKYYQVVDLFQDDKIESFTLNLSSGSLVYKERGSNAENKYTVPDVNMFVEDIKDYAQKNNVKYDYNPGSSNNWLLSALPSFIMMLLLLGLMYYMFKRMNVAMMNDTNKTLAFGKARVKPKDSNHKVTFDDVAGCDEEKAELAEIVDFFKGPEKYTKLGARIPKGVLLVGPPGTGKTLLAKAVAGEADAPFFSISGSDFVEMYVGVGAARVRDLFQQAKKSAPSIIFIDEIDAVGRHRGAGLGGGNDEREQTLNQILVEMDGFGENEGVIVMAATNRPDVLDPALMRPGRFDRQITVSRPDVDGREAILKVHARNKPLAPDVNLRTIANETAGFTGADLENLLNESALLAARKNHLAITEAEIEEATIKVVVGTEKKSHRMTAKEKKITAYHEAGHAIATYFLPSQDPVHEISIIPRGMAGGYTLSIPSEDKNYMSKNDMLDEIVVLLGGRTSEAIIFGDITTGASNDIERASEMSRNMVTKYGMSDELGPITFGSGNDEVFLGEDMSKIRNYSENVQAQIDKVVNKYITSAYSRCEEILRNHIDKLHRVAEYLIVHEKMDGETFASIMSSTPEPAAVPQE